MSQYALPAHSHVRARVGGVLTLLSCLSACSLQAGGSADRLTSGIEQSDAAPVSGDGEPGLRDAASVPEGMDDEEHTLDGGASVLDAMLPVPVADASTHAEADAGPDGVGLCPGDAGKIEPGVCGCDLPDTDKDGDSVADCIDACPGDRSKSEPGSCGCGKQEQDRDQDGVADCIDACPRDPDKVTEGACGCGKEEVDRNGDGVADCKGRGPKDKPGPRRRLLWWLPRFSPQ